MSTQFTKKKVLFSHKVSKSVSCGMSGCVAVSYGKTIQYHTECFQLFDLSGIGSVNIKLSDMADFVVVKEEEAFNVENI